MINVVQAPWTEARRFGAAARRGVASTTSTADARATSATAAASPLGPSHPPPPSYLRGLIQHGSQARCGCAWNAAAAPRAVDIHELRATTTEDSRRPARRRADQVGPSHGEPSNGPVEQREERHAGV